MKRVTILILILSAMLLSACGPSSQGNEADSGTAPSLLVSGGETSKTYTRADLEALPATQSVFKDVTYVGVRVSDLLQDAGFTVDELKAVKAVASDGYTVNYDPGQVLAEDVIVAYARADGDLAEDDGSFRMVLPGAEGKLNVRMLVEMQVIK
jgi:Oxidoreductase molybdopterin binding domain